MAMTRIGRSVLLAVAVLIAFWLIWSRLRIIVWVNANFGQLLLLMAVLAVVIFLGLDHLINRTRS
jgi:predicted permease